MFGCVCQRTDSCLIKRGAVVDEIAVEAHEPFHLDLHRLAVVQCLEAEVAGLVVERLLLGLLHSEGEAAFLLGLGIGEPPSPAGGTAVSDRTCQEGSRNAEQR